MGATSAKLVVTCGRTVIGYFFEAGCDMPWQLGRFEASEHFDAVKPLFDARNAAKEQGFTPETVWALRAVKELPILLTPSDGRAPIKPDYFYIADDRASYRC
ncbi:hypothetical protein ACIGW3_14700 [Streptomyces sp. NPDC053499]|uniref:hypothetical protein n=1 Tax=Streptomyces sp. NPDC053499 TaxID=3365707 RepID=UPI0037D5B01F